MNALVDSPRTDDTLGTYVSRTLAQNGFTTDADKRAFYSFANGRGARSLSHNMVAALNEWIPAMLKVREMDAKLGTFS